MITLMYALISFTNIGDLKAPQTFIQVKNSTQEYVFDIQDVTPLRSLSMFVGRNEETRIAIEVSRDGSIWLPVGNPQVLHERIQFMWVYSDMNIDARYIKLTVTSNNVSLHEVAFFRQDGGAQLAHVKCSTGPELVDEQDLVSLKRTFLNSTYFDEYFYVANGYDVLNGDEMFDRSHPPLASTLIVLLTKNFGISPFVYRFSGNLLGVLMIPLLYVFALKMFNSRNTALFAAFLLAFDFMHFVQSRVAVIEVFLVFFVLLACFLLYCLFIDSYEEERPLRLWLLPLTGVVIGLALSCKWTGGYVVLAAIPICTIIGRNESRKLKRRSVLRFTFIALSSILVTPAAVYFCSFVPVMLAQGGVSYFFDYNAFMAGFHEGYYPQLIFASEWYEWLTVTTPFLYDSNALVVDGTMMRSSIVCMGNPLLWWLFIPATVGAGIILLNRNVRTVIGERGNAVYLLVLIAMMFLPWPFIGRVKFIYYFFMYVPIFILLLCMGIRHLLHIGWISKLSVMAFSTLIVVTFGLFYPILSGMLIDPEPVRSWLQVLPGWHLVY